MAISFVADDTLVAPVSTGQKFVPDPDQHEVVYDDARTGAYKVPSGLTAPQINYAVGTQVDGHSPNDYIGGNWVGPEWTHEAGRSLAAGISRLPQIPALGQLEQSETALQSLRKIDNGDFFESAKQFLPILNNPQISWGSVFSKENRQMNEQRIFKNIDDQNAVISANDKFLKDSGLAKTQNDGAIYDVAGFGLSAMEAVGLFVATKNAALTALPFAIDTKTQSYKEARANSLDPQSASTVSTVSGVTTWALNAIGAHYLGAGFQAAKPIENIFLRTLAQIGVAPAEQAGLALADTSSQEAIMQVSGGRKKSLEQTAKDIFYQTLLGFVGGIPAGVLHVAAMHEGIKSGMTEPQTADIVKAATSEETISAAQDVVSQDVKLHQMFGDDSHPDNQQAAQVARDIAAGKTNDNQPQEAIDPVQQRLQKISDAVATLDQQVSDQEKLVAAAQSDGKSSRALENRVNDLLERRKTLLFERADIWDAQDRGAPPDLNKKQSTETQPFKEDVIVTGRRKKIADDVGSVDREIASQKKIIDERSLSGRPTKAIENTLETLERKRSHLLAEKDIIDIAAARAEQARIAKSKPVTLRAQVVESLRTAGDDKAQAALREGLRAGAKMAKKDVRAAQEDLIKLLDSSGLSRDNKARFIKTIKNLQTSGHFTKRWPKIAARIDDLLNTQQKNAIQKQLERELAATKVRKQSGRPVGKYGGDIQSSLDIVRKIMKMAPDDAEQKLNQNLDNPEHSGYDAALENMALNIRADGDDARTDDMIDLLTEVKSLKEFGTSETMDKLVTRSEAVKNLQTKIIEDVGAKFNPDTEVKTDGFKNFLKSAQQGSGNLHREVTPGFYDLLHSMFTDPRLSEQLDVSGLSTKKASIEMRHASKMVDAIKDVFGAKNDIAAASKLADDNMREQIGEYINAKGKKVLLQMTRSERRDVYMKMQNEAELVNNLMHEDGNAYTPEMLEAITSGLTPEDIKFSERMLDAYNDFLPEINRVYEKLNNVKLPEIDNYSPSPKEGDVNPLVSEFFGVLQDRKSVTPGSAKSRRTNHNAIAIESDITAYTRHVSQMAHYIAFAEKATQLNSVFANKEVRRMIEGQFGKKAMGQVEEYLKIFSGSRKTPESPLDGAVNYFNQAYAISKLAGKVAMMPKQLVGGLAYLDGVKTSDFLEGIGHFIANPIKHVERLSGTDYMRARGISQELQIAQYGKSKISKLGLQKSKLVEWLLKPITWGDHGAIYWGGAARMYAKMKAGMSEADAIADFEKFSEETQQSSNPEQLSSIARRNSFARGLTMFKSAGAAMYRMEARAVRDYTRGNISMGDFAKKIAIYHFAIPALYQFVSSGFNTDDITQFGDLDRENKLRRAMVLGNLDSIAIGGDIIQNVWRQIAGGNVSKGDEAYLQWAQHFGAALAQAINSEGDREELLGALKEFVTGAAMVGGAPVDQAQNMVAGTEDLSDGNYSRGILRILGWPEKAVQDIGQN